MSIFVDNNTKLLVQGITGKEGQFHTRQCIAYGTNVVAGVTPGKGGTDIFGVPIFDTMNEAVKCNICLGYIKPGLNAVTCVCGKHFHERCAERLSDCPVCEASLQEPEDLLDVEG